MITALLSLFARRPVVHSGTGEGRFTVPFPAFPALISVGHTRLIRRAAAIMALLGGFLLVGCADQTTPHVQSKPLGSIEIFVVDGCQYIANTSTSWVSPTISSIRRTARTTFRSRWLWKSPYELCHQHGFVGLQQQTTISIPRTNIGLWTRTETFTQPTYTQQRSPPDYGNSPALFGETEMNSEIITRVIVT
jgi:hypothetical protein